MTSSVGEAGRAVPGVGTGRPTGDVCVFQADATVGPAVGVRGVVLVAVDGPVVLDLRLLVAAGLGRSLGAGRLLSLQAITLGLCEFTPEICPNMREISQ